jgi:hypothetical protein
MDAGRGNDLRIEESEWASEYDDAVAGVSVE